MCLNLKVWRSTLRLKNPGLLRPALPHEGLRLPQAAAVAGDSIFPARESHRSVTERCPLDLHTSDPPHFKVGPEKLVKFNYLGLHVLRPNKIIFAIPRFLCNGGSGRGAEPIWPAARGALSKKFARAPARLDLKHGPKNSKTHLKQKARLHVLRPNKIVFAIPRFLCNGGSGRGAQPIWPAAPGALSKKFARAPARLDLKRGPKNQKQT